MNELSKQQMKNFALILSGLMIVAFFLPAFSIMGKSDISFWDFLKVQADGPIKIKDFLYVIPLLLMLVEPIYCFYKIIAKDSLKVLFPVLIAGGAFFFFLLIFYSELKSGSSQYVNISDMVSYKIGFYLYLFPVLGLAYISFVFKGTDTGASSVPSDGLQSGKTLQSSMKRFIPTKGMKFLPLGSLDKFEVSHFDNTSIDSVFAAKVARISVILGVVMIYIGSDIARRLGLYVTVSSLLICALVLSVLVACYFLMPVIKGTKAVNDKVFYTIFAVLVALIAAYIGFAFAFIVIIYIIIYLAVNGYRRYADKAQEQNPTVDEKTDNHQ